MAQLIDSADPKLITVLLECRSSAEAARRLGLSQSKAWRAAHKAGIDLTVGRRNARELTEHQTHLIVLALQENPNASYVAKHSKEILRFSASYGTVYRIAKKNGIPLKPGNVGAGRPKKTLAAKTL